MYETRAPTHGFFAVTVAFWVYVGLAGAIALAAWTLWRDVTLALAVFALAALVLLKPFYPLFRRLSPERSGEEKR